MSFKWLLFNARIRACAMPLIVVVHLCQGLYFLP